MKEEPSRRNDTDYIGHMTPYTETDKGAKAENYEKTESSWTEEILVAETATSLTEGEMGKVESRGEISAMIQCMKACKRFRACCKCQGCLNRRQEKRSKRSTEEIVGSIADKIKQINWPNAIGESKLAFVQITDATRKRDKPKGYLAWTLLRDCQVKLAAEAEQEGEVVVLKDARQFIFGFKPANEDCKFKAGTEIKLVTGVEQVRRVHRRNHKGQRMINCTKTETVPWIMQDTTWSLMAVDPWTKEWSERMEELTNEAQELRGMQLEWQREGIKKVVTLENIMCPVTNHMTESLKESIESFEAQKLEKGDDQDIPSLVSDDFSDHDEEDAQGVVHCDEGVFDTQVMAAEDWKKLTEKDKIRLLMWNPENLAQRLNLGGTTDRGKKIRMNSPPLRSVKKEWIEQILAVNPQFIIYNEASLPGSDTQKRKNHKVIIKEAEEFHESMNYRLIVGFEGRGHASHGGAIAVKFGTVITDIHYSFTGGREKQGRVLCVRVETETDETTGANGIWIVQMYMHNSGAKKRESMMKAYGMWAETHGEPVIIGSDTNSIDDMKQDVEMHVHKNSAMRNSGNDVSLKDTLNMKTGEAIPDSGLEKAEIFLGARRDGMKEFYVRNKLVDARGDDVGTLAHTCHFAWMRWHQYAKKNRGKIGTGKHEGKEIIYAGMPPCITARIDRFLLSLGVFEVTKMEVFNDLADEHKRNEYAQAEASNLSDHYAMALEVRPQASLKKGVTRVVINIMHDIIRTPEEEVRHTACEVEDEVVEPSPKEQEAEAQAAKDRELQRIEETSESKMPDKWSRVTRKAMEMKVTLKRLANAIPVTETDELHQEVTDILREAGWLEQGESTNCDEGEELPRRFDESGEELPDLERICAPRGFAHTTEGMKLLDKVLEAATFIRLWKQQNADVNIESNEKSRKALQGVTTDTKERQNEESELIHEKIKKLMASKTQTTQVRRWRTYVAGRTFRAASALHYLNCAYSDNNNTHVLLRTRAAQDDKEASSRTLVTNVIKCIQDRRMRQATQVSDESALSEIAKDSTEGVLDEITEMMQEGQLEDIREFLVQGMKSQNEGEVALTEDTNMISNFRRVPECFTRTPDNIGMHEVNIAQEVREEDTEQRLSVALRNAIMAKTNPRRTTRIRGQVAMGEWSGVIGKRHEEGKRMGELIEMSEENCQFDRAEHEDDMLIDTGCSYTIVSKEWLGEYCTKNKLDVRSVLIAYPKDYERPVASTASEGTMVRGIGFARVKLRIVTLPTGYDLEWSEDGIRSGAGTSVTEIDTYVHVFEQMASAWLLGMPFIQEFTTGWDMEAKQVILKDNKGIKGAVPLHSKEEVPLRPVMVCTKEDIRLQPQCEADVRGYTIGTSNFPSQAEFHVMDEQGNGKWAEEGQISEGTTEKVQLEYGIEPIQDFDRLHSGSGFVAYGVEGRNMLGGQLHSPTVRICSIENEAIDIPAGTPVGIIVQKCQGIPTYEWGRDYKFTKVPSKLEKKDRRQTRAIPSPEIQKACEYSAAKLLEGVIQDVTTQAETGEKGAEQDETIKDIMACHRIQEELERLRDSCGVKTSNLTPQEKISVHQMEKAEARKLRPSSSSHFGYGYSRKKALQSQMRWRYDEDKEKTDWTEEKAAKEAGNLAKMLVQMLWHLMENTRLKSHQNTKHQSKDGIFTAGQATNHADSAEASNAMKRLLKHFRDSINTNEWREWMKRHERESAVHALLEELEADTYENFVVEEISDYEDETDEEEDTEYTFRDGTQQRREVQRTELEENRILRKQQRHEVQRVQTEAGKQIEEANKDLDELRQMLTSDTAAGGDVMAAIMEQPVSIVEFFQKRDKDGELQECPDGKGWEKRNIEDIMDLIDEEWAKKIKEACRDKVENDNNVEVEDEHRINRMAAYMMMVDTTSISDEPKNVRLLFEYILLREPFYNINPNNPPRFVGESFDYVRMKPGESSISHQERRIPPSALKPVLDQIKEWMQQGVVEKSNSPHSSPLLLVKKKALSPPLMADGKPDPNYVAKVRWRTCVDYVQLNNKSAATDISNAPRVDELLDYIGLAGSHKEKKPGDEYWVSTVDLYAGFNQWYLSDEVRPLTAFTVPGLAAEEGRLQFRVLPFGLASAPTRFNSLVAETLAELRFGHHKANQANKEGDIVRACCTNYIDDVFVADICTFEEHLKDMNRVFERLQKAGFGARMDKAEFCRHEISMLGWTIAEGYKSAQDSKIKKIDELLDVCSDVKDVLSLLGTVGFYRQLIPMSGDIEAPLYDLTKKGAWSENAWTPIHTACVKLLKYHLKEQVKLAIPRIGNDATGKKYPPMQLATDASQYAGGAVLFQEQADGVERPICFASKTFTKEQRNWSATERELWTLQYFATEHFRQFFIGDTPILYTDHKPLTYLFKNRNTTNAKIARWSAKLSKLRAIVEYRAGAKMGPADTFSRMMKDRPERGRRDLETPENREPMCHHRGPLQEFEPEDTKERTISLPREAGIPQQRVTFLKGSGTAKEVVSEGTPETQHELVQHGSIVSEEVVNRMEPLQKERIEVLRKAAEEHGYKPEFRVALAFDVTKVEEGIPSEADRVEKSRKHREQIKTEEEAGMFPNTAVVWTTIARKHMSNIFTEATGEYVKDEEEEYLCPVEQMRDEPAEYISKLEGIPKNQFVAMQGNEPGSGYTHEIQCVRDNIFAGMNELKDEREGGRIKKMLGEHMERTFMGKADQWSMEDSKWENDDSDYDEPDEDEVRENEVCRVLGENTRALTDNQQMKKLGQNPQVMGEDAKEASPLSGEPNFEGWKEVERKIIDVTKKRLADLSPTNDDTLSESQKEFINALCDPKVSIVVCQGAAGCGKTYTAMLTACLAIEAGLLKNVKQTKPLVSTGGVGLGFERGEMADKLKYWCAPAREAMERIQMSEENRKKVEAFPIDRTRGISVPAHEQMIFDEMQNAPKSLWDAAMTRAEEYGKVVLCGDINQIDAINTKTLGMKRFLESWDGGLKEKLAKVEAEVDKLQEQVDKATESNKAQAEKKLRDKKYEMRPLANAFEGFEIMRRSTRVIDLGGSRALRSKSSSCITSFLNVCKVEQEEIRGQDLQVMGEDALTEASQKSGEVEVERTTRSEICQVDTSVVDETSCDRWHKSPRDTVMEKLADREMQDWAKDVVSGTDAQIRQSALVARAVTKKDTTIIARNSKQEINQAEGRKRPHTTAQQAPIFASFAGMDLLGMGLTRTFKAGKCVGGSECNNSARLLFRREHGFEPFRDHENVPSYAYKHIFMVTTGAPCVAFSKAGLQKGQSDKRGCYYVAQVDAYIQAEVPVILFEQVREAREILRGDSVANGRKMSPQDQLVEKLEEAGYVVPKGPDGKAGFVMNAANQGSVLDRSRLFTLAVRKELYDKSMKNKEFKWPEDKAKNTRSIGDIFREPVEPSHLASAHVMEGFKRKEWETRTGVQYKLSKGQGIGEWYNANTVIGEKGKGLSITAMGNSRWVEFVDIDGKTQWRRLSGVETARAFGIKENELRKFQHLNDQEIHAAVGNGVCIEMGEAMGKVVEQFWDPEWFQVQCTEKAKGEDIFCLEGGTIDIKYEDSKKLIISQMGQKEQAEVQEIQTKGYEMADSKATNPHTECNRVDVEKKHKSIKSKEQEDNRANNRVKRIQRGEEDMLSEVRLKDKFARALQNERMMFRRRVKKAIEGTQNVNEIEWDVEISKAAADGSAGIWDGAEVFRNESKDLKDHDFLWKGKTTSNYEDVNPTVPNIRDSNCKDLAKAQKKDPRYRNLIKFMDGTLQEKEISKVDKAELSKESDRYCFVDGILCRITNSERTGSTVRVCVPSSYQDELMRMCHDNPWTCHPTTDQMFRMLGLRYYWPQMRMSCAMYADTCDTCQRTGYPPKRGAGGRQYIPTSSPFACVAIDIVGPIGNKDSVTEKGNRYIVTMIDWFTRWIEAYAVKDQSEKSIIEALEHFTSRHGIPRRLVSDNAKYFRSKLIHQWEKDNGLKHTFVSAYRPQGNGKLERFHRVLGRKVKQQCWDAGDEQWDRHLEKITFAHNVVPHSTTGYSPFELVHGRLPVVPFDTLMPPTDEDASPSHGAYMDIIKKRTTTAWQIAYENMSDKQTESTNLVAAENVRIQNYRAGDSIMLWVPSIPKGKSKKITCKWHGPYSVSEVNKGKQVTITMPDGHGAMKDRSVHQARVKRFKERGKEMATNIQSEEVFEWLERHEVDVVEGKSKTTGLDLLKRAPAREHIVGGKSRDEERWEQLWDGTERIGEIAGQADGTIDPEVPIPTEEKSPFDGQQLIEQTILDLTQNDNLLLKRCHECDKAQHAWHSCETCFEMAVNGKLTESTHAQMHYPMFREVKQDIEDPDKTEEASCDTCKCAIWIPSQYCQCGDEEKQTEGHTDIMTGEPIPAMECPVCPELYEPGKQGIKMEFNMGYPVIVQDGEVRPRVYNGKTALPPKKKGQLWQQVVRIVDSESEPESDEGEITHGEDKATEGEAMEDQIYEAKSIIEYDEWEWKYEVTWKGYSHTDTTAQGVQDLVAAEGLVEEYWADPDTGVKKWKKLRPGLDNMKQTMEMLKSSKQMEMSNIKVAGVQLCQAIGKSDTHIYNRLKAQEIRSTDVFNVILDVGVTKLLNTKKEKKKLAMEGKRKLIIPVKWTWSRLYKVCTPTEIKAIRIGLASAAKEKRHTYWAKSYKEMPTMGGAKKPNKEEFVVVNKEAMAKQIERVINQVTQQQTSKWQTQEQRTQNQTNANEFRTKMQAFMLEQDDDATDECNPELEPEEEQMHETSLQAPTLCAGTQELTEVIEQQEVQIKDEVQDTESGTESVQEVKSSTEKWDPAQNGGFVKFWQDQDETEVCNMEVQAEVQIVKTEEESEVRAMHYLTQKQQQSITTAFNMLRKWGRGRLKGKWLECPHGAVRMEGHQKRPYGFVMQDKSPMPRCKIPECLERIVKGQRWIHQVNHQVNQTSGNQVYQVENETIHFEQRIRTQMIKEIKSSEQMDIAKDASTLHQTEEPKGLQDPQQEQDMNEVRRVIKISEVDNTELDATGQAILDKIFKDTVDRHIELRNRTEVNMEAKKKEFMLRHWECNTKAEEMELKSQEMKLMQEQEKHEIEMQERRNEMNRQQEEHKRRMSSNLW